MKVVLIKYSSKTDMDRMHRLKSEFHSTKKGNEDAGIFINKSVKTRTYFRSPGCEDIKFDWFDTEIRNVNRVEGDIIHEVNIKDVNYWDLQENAWKVVEKELMDVLWKEKDRKRHFKIINSMWSDDIYEIRELSETVNPYKDIRSYTFWNRRDAEIEAVRRIRKEIESIEGKNKPNKEKRLQKLKNRMAELSKFGKKFKELKEKREDIKND